MLSQLLVCVALCGQLSPEEKMTGKLYVNGRNSGTAFLVGDRVIMTDAHCIYNPNRGWDRKDYTVAFYPGASVNARGQLVAPYGSFKGVMPMGFSVEWWDLARMIDRVKGDAQKQIIHGDWALVTLDRSPRLGYFDLTVDLPGFYIANTEGIGYPTFARGQPYRRKLDMCLFDTDPKLVVTEDIVDINYVGMSGAPYFFRHAETGRLTVYAFHGWASGKGNSHQWHRRITPEIVRRIEKFKNSESANLAMQ